jgi:Major Facilitator Superfamily
VYFQHFDWDETIRGTILSSFFWGYIVTQVPSGYIATRFGATKLLFFMMLICTAATLLFPVASTLGWEWACASRVLLGLAQVRYITLNYSISRERKSLLLHPFRTADNYVSLYKSCARRIVRPATFIDESLTRFEICMRIYTRNMIRPRKGQWVLTESNYFVAGSPFAVHSRPFGQVVATQRERKDGGLRVHRYVLCKLIRLLHFAPSLASERAAINRVYIFPTARARDLHNEIQAERRRHDLIRLNTARSDITS